MPRAVGGLYRSPAMLANKEADEEAQRLLDLANADKKDDPPMADASALSQPPPGTMTATGFKVLCLLAVQNCSKNLVMRYAVQDKPDFLYSAAVIGSEMTKLTLSVLWILVMDKGSPRSIATFLRLDWWNAVLLSVPAAVYNLQQTLEYVALSNLDAAVFSVLVQSKLLCTAIFAVILMRRRLRKAQVISLVLLTTGVMLANLNCAGGSADPRAATMDTATGVMATLGISLASGFAAVYTEKVIKATQKASNFDRSQYSLAYMQVRGGHGRGVGVGVCVWGGGVGHTNHRRP